MKLNSIGHLLSQSKYVLLITLTLQGEILAGSSRSAVEKKKETSQVITDSRVINSEWAEKQEKLRAKALLERQEKEDARKKAEEERVLRRKEEESKEKKRASSLDERQLDARRAAPNRSSMLSTFLVGILSCVAIIAAVAGLGNNIAST